jgi:hypothetical protein
MKFSLVHHDGIQAASPVVQGRRKYHRKSKPESKARFLVERERISQINLRKEQGNEHKLSGRRLGPESTRTQTNPSHFGE